MTVDKQSIAQTTRGTAVPETRASGISGAPEVSETTGIPEAPVAPLTWTPCEPGASGMIIPEVLSSTQPYKGLVTTIKLDTLTRGDGTTFVREVAMMTGAVAIAAVDELQRILLIRQYRHPMKRPMWEIPAGTMDVEGEPPALTAARELREEADLLAGHVELLTVFGNSVGRSTEMTHLYLAKDLEEAPEFERTNEEADIEKAWVPLPEALAMIKDGTIADAKTIIGILMASRG